MFFDSRCHFFLCTRNFPNEKRKEAGLVTFKSINIWSHETFRLHSLYQDAAIVKRSHTLLKTSAFFFLKV